MDILEYLFNIYNKTFFSKASNRISLNKIEEKVNKINKTTPDRTVLYSACARFVNYLDSDIPQAISIKKELEQLLKSLVKRDYNMFKKFVPDVDVKTLFNENEIYKALTADNIYAYYIQTYVPANIKKSIHELIVTNPEDDYPEAREMKRHFVLHIGPTNSGKTYESLERLKECEKGIYLGPLRLLALEIYDRFNRADVPCNMVTGEEELLVDNAVCQASTIEMLNTNDYFDIAVIDEAQMIQDARRGYNWTKAILGIKANEIHVCMAHQAESIVIDLINRCNDTYEIHYHERMTPLKFDDTNINYSNFHEKLEPGDALIVFSKKSVLAVAAELERKNIKASVIYGNLPPDTRKHQVELFTSGKTKVIVSTDAIGMGLNLPIRRIIFLETVKYDGNEKRILNSQEIKQIAGRAGRKGIYDEGFCLAIQDREYIKNSLNEDDPIITSAPIGFPETLLNLPYEMNYIIQTWAEVKPHRPYVKMDVKELIFLYSQYNSINKNIRSEHTKEDVYNFITCPVDIKDSDVIWDWLSYCRNYINTDSYYIPECDCADTDLEGLESFYKRLDLYFQFSRKTKKDINFEEVANRKKDTVLKINKILKEDSRNFSRKCSICGKPLPLAYEYGMCNKCFKRRNFYWG